MIIREGFDSLQEAEEDEEDLLDKAWGLEPESRLSCQALVGDASLVIEIPKYTINMVSEPLNRGYTDEPQMDGCSGYCDRAG